MSDEEPQGVALASLPLTSEYLDMLAVVRSPSRPRLRCDACGASRDGNLYADGLVHALCPRPTHGTFRGES